MTHPIIFSKVLSQLLQSYLNKYNNFFASGFHCLSLDAIFLMLPPADCHLIKD